MVIPIFQTDPGHPDYIAQNYGCQAFDEAPVFWWKSGWKPL